MEAPDVNEWCKGEASGRARGIPKKKDGAADWLKLADGTQIRHLEKPPTQYVGSTLHSRGQWMPSPLAYSAALFSKRATDSM
jgi:hypothetical protein